MGKKIWFITGASSGLGVANVKVCLEKGYRVVAAARRKSRMEELLGPETDDLMLLEMDITKIEQIRSAVKIAMDRFGQIDVLNNNAGAFIAGFFENTSDRQIRDQMEIDFFGAQNVTREVLPIMRKQRSGMIITTSTAGALTALDFCGAYAASKFAEEGWMESLRYDVAPYGIKCMIAEPGTMRTSIRTASGMKWPDLDIEDYRERTVEKIAQWMGSNGKQPGDPIKYAKGLVYMTELEEPPFRYMAGEDTVSWAEKKAAWLLKDANTARDILVHQSFDDDLFPL